MGTACWKLADDVNLTRPRSCIPPPPNANEFFPQPRLPPDSLFKPYRVDGHMDSSLQEVWQAAAGSPFLPTIGKGSQFFVGFLLLLLGLAITGGFALSKLSRPLTRSCAVTDSWQIDLSSTSRCSASQAL